MLDYPLSFLLSLEILMTLCQKRLSLLQMSAGSEPRQQDHLDRFKSPDKVTQEGFHLCLLPVHAL